MDIKVKKRERERTSERGRENPLELEKTEFKLLHANSDTPPSTLSNPLYALCRHAQVKLAGCDEKTNVAKNHVANLATVVRLQ